MTEFECKTEMGGCGESFSTDFPYGDPVKCPNCGIEWETDMEESDDSLYAWITRKVKDGQQ